eukprot:sb/3476844/
MPVNQSQAAKCGHVRGVDQSAPSCSSSANDKLLLLPVGSLSLTERERERERERESLSLPPLSRSARVQRDVGADDHTNLIHPKILVMISPIMLRELRCRAARGPSGGVTASPT